MYICGKTFFQSISIKQDSQQSGEIGARSSTSTTLQKHTLVRYVDNDHASKVEFTLFW